MHVILMNRFRPGTRAAGRCVVLAALAFGPLSACSGQSGGSDGTATSSSAVSAPSGPLPLRVELIHEAVATLETKLGGPQQYFEVNATPTLVNLFVATDNATRALAYVYVDGKLSEPAPPEQVKAGAPTFAARDLTFDDKRVLEPVLIALTTSSPRVFSAVGVVGGAVSYLITMESTKGGQLQVPVKADGSIIGAVQN